MLFSITIKVETIKIENKMGMAKKLFRHIAMDIVGKE